MGFLDGLRDQLEDLKSSKMFPIYWLTGGIVVAAFTSDILWVYIAIGGFAFLMLGGYFLD